uniref:RNA-directed DNA polymerase n=1 Tax=Acrobeloides nanus TaxID=290746 RepID=A0A914CW25_9BILA
MPSTRQTIHNKARTSTATTTTKTVIDAQVNITRKTARFQPTSFGAIFAHYLDIRILLVSRRRRSMITNLPRTTTRRADDLTNKLRKFVTLDVNETQVTMQLDNGADICLLPESCVKRFNGDIKPTNRKAKTATGAHIRLIGEVEVNATFRQQQVKHIIYVTSNKHKLHLLSSDLMDKLKFFDLPFNDICDKINDNHGMCCCQQRYLVNNVKSTENIDFARKSCIDDFLKRYPNVFSPGLGHCKMFKAHLQLKAGSKPIFRKHRSVPYASQQAVEQELRRLEQIGTITKVNYADWAAPIHVVRKKNGNTRVTVDFSTGLNDSLEMHQYHLPLPDDIFAHLNGGKFFSIIDFSDAYLQIEMDDESKALLTINTHNGLYRYERLAFGVKSAPGIFQEGINKMLSGLSGVTAYLDDVIVTGSTIEEHQNNLQKVFQRINSYGFKVRLEKCIFLETSVRYLGHIIDADGRRPDPEKIKAINDMPPPTNLTEFVWNQQCQQNFERIKSIFNSNLLLTHYDPTLPIYVAADASNNGIGAVVMHKFPDGRMKAIMHAARTYGPSEKSYSQIEREALALTFGVKKFHKMLLGRKFKLLTDHRPLLAIFGSKKGLPAHTSNRLLRWGLMLLAYDFTLEYVKTSDFGCVDTLSRLIKEQRNSNDDEIIIAQVEAPLISQILNIEQALAPVTAVEVAQASEHDQQLQAVQDCLKNGWPDSKMVEKQLLPFFRRKESLANVNGCLMSGERIIIPQQLRRKVLQTLHRGHPGIVRMKALARSHVYWPDIDADIETTVKNCNNCAMAQKNPIKTELQSWPQTSAPWSRIHVDYAGPMNGFTYLVVVDSFSKWPEIFQTKSTTSKATIRLLRRLFASYGIPDVLVSDNGTQFTSNEFKSFVKSNGINHALTAPYHPQSNGQAERFVDILKRGLQKLNDNNDVEENLQVLLATYRTTPSETLANRTPAEMFLRRKPKTTLDLLKPLINTIPAKTRNNKMECAFNKKNGAKQRSFEPEQSIWGRDFRIPSKIAWAPGKIIRRIGNVKYEVHLEPFGFCYRHANQIRTRSTSNNHQNMGNDFNVLLDAFNLPTFKPDATPSKANHVPQQNGAPVAQRVPVHYERRPRPNRNADAPIVRRSNRNRRLVEPFDPAEAYRQDQLHRQRQDRHRHRSVNKIAVKPSVYLSEGDVVYELFDLCLNL